MYKFCRKRVPKPLNNGRMLEYFAIASINQLDTNSPTRKAITAKAINNLRNLAFSNSSLNS